MDRTGVPGFTGLHRACVCNSTFLHHKYWFIWFTRNLTLVNLLTAAGSSLDVLLIIIHRTATHHQMISQEINIKVSPLVLLYMVDTVDMILLEHRIHPEC